jgi:UDP-N-acetyl-D-glucosamine dehydrogenase
MESVELSAEYLASMDCVVIATGHSCYDMSEVVANAKLIFDTRGATRKLKGDNIVRLGE